MEGKGYDEDEEASVVKFVNQIIREALDQQATDTHVEPLADNLRIRYRIDGGLVARVFSAALLQDLSWETQTSALWFA